MKKLRSNIRIFCSIVLVCLFAYKSATAQTNAEFYRTCSIAGQFPICSATQFQDVILEMSPLSNITGSTPLCSNGGTPQNTHWISFIAGEDAADFDLDIIMSQCVGNPGDTGVQWGIVGDCSFTEVICDGICNPGPGVISIITSLIPGRKYYLWLDGCGGSYCRIQLDFNAGLNNIPSCYNEPCSTTNGTCGNIFNPVTNLNGNLDFQCHTGCLTAAVPSTISSDCGLDTIPTTWFQVITDANTFQLFVTVETEGLWAPVFAVFQGSCPNLSAISNPNAPICSNDWMSGNQINYSVSPNSTYWIAVGGLGDADNILDNPAFTICTATSIQLITCIGDFGGQCDDVTDWTLMDSSNPSQNLGDLDDQSNAAMPYLCPGETVEICASFIYDSLDLSVDWLIGIIPILGDGWDKENYDPESFAVLGNGINAVWFDYTAPLAPLIQEPAASLCTYTDSNGDLALCNSLCSACPCDPGMTYTDPLPSGWFWLTTGGNAGCDNDGSPGESWGIGIDNPEINLCFELTVRDDFNSDAACSFADLTVGFQTLSDGVAGCWEDPVGECLLDESQTIKFNISCETDTYYSDLDGDGYGDLNSPVNNCFDSPGIVSNSDDCNDMDNMIYPGSTELCDGIDNDCDGQIDEGFMILTYYFDLDMDGWGDPNNSISSCTQPTGTLLNSLDCNDDDPLINPDATELCDGVDNNCDGQIDEGLNTSTYFTDNDMDGFGDPNDPIIACSQPAGTVTNDQDCNDNDATINPDATEICDDLDNNCDGQVDEGLNTITYYLDNDSDGYGDPENPIIACSQPAGTVTNDQDCNDNDATINPDATEVCDNIDNNCDGQIDEGLNTITYYLDNDSDGFGDPENPIVACSQPAGTVTNDQDCNDNDATINPDATEICDDLDNNCDGQVDEGFTPVTYYADNDSDGYGDPENPIVACSQPAGTVTNDQDCNDNDATINPDATEICDDLDNNCDGQVDEGLNTITYYLDNDSDGFGDPENPIVACSQPTGTVTNDQDCNDNDATINPDATEICDDLDNNCDGQVDEGFTPVTYYADNDSDGYGDPENPIVACSQPTGTVTNDQDCNDNDATINPDATEICDDLDNNCDGQIDEGFTPVTYYADNDSDGYGDPENPIVACSQPTGYVLSDQDCNDNDASINPDATEICDDIDNNCDGQIDEGFTYQDYWIDADMDGFGDPLTLTNNCEQPTGTVSNGDDCDDMNPDINPEADDIPDNGIDEDCDGMDATSATHELAGNSISIYPNPTSGKIFISIEGHLNIDLALFDINGKRIMQQASLNMDLSKLSDGIYLLRVSDTHSEEYIMERIVLSR